MPIPRRHPQCIVIGADTLVAVDGLVLGKPADEADAARMLRMLSGRRHQVIGGVALLCGNEEVLFHCVSEVRFFPLREEEIAAYIRSGEPMASRGWAVCSSKASAEIISTSWACRYPGSCARLINFHDTGRDLCVFFPTKFERCRLGKLSKTVYNRRGEFWKNKEVRRR